MGTAQMTQYGRRKAQSRLSEDSTSVAMSRPAVVNTLPLGIKRSELKYDQSFYNIQSGLIMRGVLPPHPHTSSQRQPSLGRHRKRVQRLPTRNDICGCFASAVPFVDTLRRAAGVRWPEQYV